MAPYLAPDAITRGIQADRDHNKNEGAAQAGNDSTHPLVAEAQALANAGFKIITVIPEALPAEQWPLLRDGKPVIDRETGKPKPRFGGKNPSCWRSDGEPQLLSHAKPETVDRVIQHLQEAISAERPIGLAVIPSHYEVVIDFDTKHYKGGEVELKADYDRLVKAHPELGRTRTERTRSGGIHIYLRVVDQMTSWLKANGKGHHCNFTTSRNGPHRGEVLCGTRISVAAPTKSSQGSYSLLPGTEPYAHTLAEVVDLTAVGITKAATEGGRGRTSQSRPQQASKSPKSKGGDGEIVPPSLRDLLRKKAQGVLRGETLYGDDRSSNYAGFLRELFGCLNWLRRQGLPYRGDADELKAEAITALGIEDKADRIEESIDPETCTWCDDDDAAMARYREVGGLEVKERGYSEYISATLKAIADGDLNREMSLRAYLKSVYRVTDDQIDTALFRAYSKSQIRQQKASHDSVDLGQVEQLDYLLDGWIPRGDVVLTYGPAGTGKTTLALAKAYAYANGRNLLDRDTPCTPGKVLFIATDSGPAALKKAMHDLEIDPDTDPLWQPGHPEQRLWVWAHAPEQGQAAWICDIHGVIRLEQFIREKGISYVVIDSAKAVSSAAGWSYAINESVKALLQYLREGVAMPTGACLEFLSHDGTASGSHSGAKAWAEDPSMVCSLELATDPATGRVTGTTATFKKDRAAHVDPRRRLTFALVDGQLQLSPEVEVVSSCAEGLLKILWEHHQRGHESLSTAQLKDEALARFGHSHKTFENTIPRIAGTGKGRNPTPVLRIRRGHYALAPAEIQRRLATTSDSSSYRGWGVKGGINSKTTAAQGICPPPMEPPEGETGGLPKPPTPPMGDSIGGSSTPVPARDVLETPPERGYATPPVADALAEANALLAESEEEWDDDPEAWRKAFA